MTDLPAISAFNASTVTEGQWKAAFADLHGYLAATLGTLGDPAAAQVATKADQARMSQEGAGMGGKSGDRRTVAPDDDGVLRGLEFSRRRMTAAAPRCRSLLQRSAGRCRSARGAGC